MSAEAVIAVCTVVILFANLSTLYYMWRTKQIYYRFHDAPERSSEKAES